MTRLLAIDTCFQACSVALLVEEGGDIQVHEIFERRQRGHAEVIVPMIQAVMAREKLAFPDLDKVAVTVGPGTFTGVRVGVAAARALHLGASLPVVTETSLRVMAYGWRRETPETRHGDIVVAVDARRDAVYCQRFTQDATSLSPPRLLPVTAAVTEMAGQSVIVGSGAMRWQAEALSQGISLEIAALDAQPQAGALARLALGARAEPKPPSPLYLRPPDAKPQTGYALARTTEKPE